MKMPSTSSEIRSGELTVPPAFSAGLVRQTLLLFFLLPLVLTLLLGVSSAVLDYYGGSYGTRSLLMISQLFAIIDDIFSPAVFSAAICTLGYGIYRMGLRNCRATLSIAILSPLVLSVFNFAVTWLLVVLRRVNVTPAAFSVSLPFYLLSLMGEYLFDLLLLLLFFLLFNNGGRKFRAQEGFLASEKQIFRKGSGFFRILSAAVWVQIALAILNRIVSILGNLSEMTETVKNYGLQSRESILTLLSVLILPILYTVITAFAIRQLSHIFAGKCEENYLAERERKSGKNR